MKSVKIKSIVNLGNQDSMNITVDSDSHLFVANGFVTSNSHAVCYTMFSAYELFFKAHYPLEFYCVVINEVDRSKEKKGVDVLNQRVRHAVKSAIKILPVDINKSQEKWSIEGNCLRAGLEIKGLGKEAETVVKNRPYNSVMDFLEKTKMGKGRMESLIFSGAFDCFDTRENVYNWYHNTYLSKGKKSQEAFFDFFDDESSSSDNLKHFTKNELKEMEYDINGYLIPENILDKYHEHIGTKLGDSRTVIKDIGTVKREVSRFPAILGRVDGIRMSKSRTGREWVYVAFSDGINDITVMMSKTKYLSRQKTFEIGNILVLPVSFPPGEDGETPDRETCFLSDEKIEIKRIA
jgi:DNA polymerase-3 subunit alpha